MPKKKASRKRTLTPAQRAARELKEVEREEAKLARIEQRIRKKRAAAEAKANREADRLIAALDKKETARRKREEREHNALDAEFKRLSKLASKRCAPSRKKATRKKAARKTNRNKPVRKVTGTAALKRQALALLKGREWGKARAALDALSKQRDVRGPRIKSASSWGLSGPYVSILQDRIDLVNSRIDR